MNHKLHIILSIILTAFLLGSTAFAATPNAKATTTRADEFEDFITKAPRHAPEIAQDSSTGSTTSVDITIDSAAIYSELEMHYVMDADVGGEALGYVLICTLYGGLATAAGIGLLSIDYGKSLLKYPGYGAGGFLVGTGAIAFLMDVLSLIISISTLASNPEKKAEEYRKKAEEWKLKVKPAINFEEPGAGLLLQLSF